MTEIMEWMERLDEPLQLVIIIILGIWLLRYSKDIINIAAAKFGIRLNGRKANLTSTPPEGTPKALHKVIGDLCGRINNLELQNNDIKLELSKLHGELKSVIAYIKSKQQRRKGSKK